MGAPLRRWPPLAPTEDPRLMSLRSRRGGLLGKGPPARWSGLALRGGPDFAHPPQNACAHWCLAGKSWCCGGRVSTLVGCCPMLKLLLGDPNARKLKRYQPIISDINLLEEEITPLSDDELRGLTAEFRQKLDKPLTLARQKQLLDELLPQAFAVVREAGRRVLGLRHFDVQLLGGMVLHEGQIAEMKTGEGKTLVATLPAYLNALTEIGRAHV